MKYLAIGALSLLCLAGCDSATTPADITVASDADSDFAAHWINEENILLDSKAGVTHVALVASREAKLDEGSAADHIVWLSAEKSTEGLYDNVPHLADLSVYRVAPTEDLRKLVKSQLAVVQLDENNQVIHTSYLQIPNLLDTLFTAESGDADEVADFGATVTEDGGQFVLWAPTAQNVSVLLFDKDKNQTAKLAMQEDEHGIWRAKSEQASQGVFYRYEMTLYHPRTQAIETYQVTDPYSLSLSRNSQYSQVVDMSSSKTQPEGWNTQQDETLSHPESLILYESHIRDFSASDRNLSNPDYAGKYKAFSETDSDGAKHLEALRDAGLNTVHLLPTYDISTVNEDPEKVIYPKDTVAKMCRLAAELELCSTDINLQQTVQELLQSYDPMSAKAQAVLEVIRPQDPYNWGYDPYHYTVPEGSYAINPDGIPRIIEFREMVQSLHNKGFRVIMDVVYNHTFASGLAEKSVLDKVVPNYYHRLNPITGNVETSTCCENSATEHRMMAKLMIDSLVVWARDYKIDGFRFDLMGHQPKAEMLEAREAVRQVDPDTYFYGEGWNFGEVANNARFVQAAQIPLAGTEIGTFTDRLRDAVRGGSSFVSAEELRFGQGIGNGLVTQPNDLQTAEQHAAIMAEYYLSMDQIRVGLAGNLSEFPLVNAQGESVKGKDIPYGDAPTGYALDPADTINYVSKHDNQTLWDNNSYRFAYEATTEQRVRMHNLSLAYPLLAQGIPFLHMGGELLRSKSYLRDSYDYGDWFNAVDFSKQSNNYHVGLPPEVKDGANWDIIHTILRNNQGRDIVKPSDIEFAANVFMDFMAIRSGSGLFSLQTAEQVIDRVKFHNTGPEQTIGLIVMQVSDYSDEQNIDAEVNDMVVVFNNHIKAQSFPFKDAQHYQLHPRQQQGADPVVKTATATSDGFTVPALSVAIFVK
ncbi:MAG: pullulanase-type alpha-1,6-glucosidase [Aestuariibacter sp.]